MRPLVAVVFSSLLLACGTESSTDTGVAPDDAGATGRDGGVPDGGITDAGAVDAGFPDDAGPDCPPGAPVGPGVFVTEQGLVRAAVRGDAYEIWGIPYATPPLDGLRWAPPRAPACWDGERDGAARPPRCPQTDDGTYPADVDEDCLYLNVFRPIADSEEPRPVLFFIHGGGNQNGGATQQQLGTTAYAGDLLAARTDAVVVTINYRLGPLGWLVHPDLPGDGNYALMDMIAALEWTRNNIASFGGDPSRVLLFGESAGAVDVCALIASPEASGLFSAALMQSGGCVASPREDARAEGVSYAADLGCAGADAEACLRAADPETLVEGLSGPFEAGLVGSLFGPVVDGVYLPARPEQMLREGTHGAVPFVVGSNADETALTVPEGSVRPFMVNALIGRLPAEFRDRLRASYPAGTTPEEARDAYIRLTSDSQFICPARRIARYASASQEPPVFLYHFVHAVDVGPLRPLGAFHGLELFYIFQTIERSAAAPALDADDDAVSSYLRGYWSAFAATGDPNHPGSPAWPAYELATDRHLELSPTPATGTALREAECDLWDEIAAAL